MTRFTPLWQQAGSYPANYDRALLATMWPVPAATGAVPAAVSNTMNVSIPPGSIAVPLQSGQHTALCRWDAPEVVSSPAAPAAGNSRIDMVVAQVRDPQLDAGANNDFIFVVVAGTPATSNPVAPAVPTNAAPVCTYTVVGGSANLNGVTIVDARRGTGLTAVFASTTERDTVWPNPPPGALCLTSDSPAQTSPASFSQWVRQGGSWVQTSGGQTAWINASLSFGWATVPGWQPAQYRKIGDNVQMRGYISGGAAGSAAMTLPAGFRPPITLVLTSNTYSGARIITTVQVRNDGQVVPELAGSTDLSFWFSTLP